jgi:hypothetical protein
LNQKIEALTDSERDWINARLQLAKRLIAIYSSADLAENLTLTALDHAFAAWMSGNEEDNQAINEVINSIGIAFGQSLIDGNGLEWVIAVDSHGSDLAVYGLPGKGDVLIYPANFVAKRWEKRETNFLQSSYDKISQDIRQLRAQSS